VAAYKAATTTTMTTTTDHYTTGAKFDANSATAPGPLLYSSLPRPIYI